MKTQALDAILDPALGLDILPADPDFPQLNIACDRERMLDVFRTHLKPASEKSYAILDCTPFRFRCRQATSRCVLQYTLRLLEPGTGRVRKLSVTGLIYAQDGAAERVWQEMQADNPRREIPDSWLTFEPVCFIPELKMVVEVFPYDRRLRVLPRFMAGPVSQLEPLLLARFGPGEWRVEERDVQPARYRTEIGVVLRYTFKARNTATAVRQMRCFYVKIYRENRGAETFQLLQSLCARPEEEQKKFTVVQPVAWLDELNSLVVEEAPGRSLEQMILEDGDAGPAVRQAARAVVAFNGTSLVSTHRSTTENQMSDLKRAAKLIHWSCPPLRGAVDGILRAIAAGLEEVPLAPIHRDLKPAHIFFAEDRVIFIDLDSFALADPVRDPAHLLANIAAKADMAIVSPEQAAAAAAARVFAEEYFAHVPASWRKRLPVHYAGALLEEAAGMFKHVEPGWREKVGTLVEQAGQALKGNLG